MEKDPLLKYGRILDRGMYLCVHRGSVPTAMLGLPPRTATDLEAYLTWGCSVRPDHSRR